jgi:hypothetical protein
VPVSKDLTELVDIDPERVDLVKNPANGFPILLMKAVDVITPEGDKTPVTDVTPTAVAPSTPAAPEPQTEPKVEKSAEDLVKEAVAKAIKPAEEAIKGLTETVKSQADELAVLKATPIPGGPSITAGSHQRAENERASAKAEAARFRKLAKDVTDRELVRYYEEKADALEKSARA